MGFDACRYNGQTIPDEFINRLGEYVDYITVCPEVEIGLGTPRAPIRIVENEGKLQLYQPESEKFFTDKMVSFTHTFLASLKKIDGFILKNRSPSCGPADVKIFQGFDKSAGAYRGSGFFGGEILKRFEVSAIEDEGRLKNFSIREHFLIKLFTFARFRLAKKTGTMGALVKFQSEHKLLLLSYNQAHYRKCGRIVANHEKLNTDDVFNMYETELSIILKKVPRYPAMINTLQHAFGWISNDLSKEEKKFFINTLEEYRDERIPLSTVLHLINAYAIRFKNNYLSDQVLLNPYPKELTEITDSGKGRNY